MESSGKMVLLLEVIQQCCYIDERVLVFSQSLSTLSYIEKVIYDIHTTFIPSHRTGAQELPHPHHGLLTYLDVNCHI